MAYRLSTHPFDALVRDLFQEGARPQNHAARYQPAVDLIESEAAYLIQVELPGFDPEALELTFEGQTLTLKGEKTLPELDASAKAHLRERRGGTFERRFKFPLPVEADAIEARFQQGVLAIQVTKTPAAQPHKVQIQL